MRSALALQRRPGALTCSLDVTPFSHLENRTQRQQVAVLRPGDPSGKHLRNPLRRGGTIAASRKETIASQGGDGVVVGTVRHERYVLGQYWSRHVSIHTTKSNRSTQHTPCRKNSSKGEKIVVDPAPLYTAQTEVSSQSASNIGLRTHTPRLSIVSAPKSAVECPSCVSIGRSKRLHDGGWAGEVGGAT